ncbi:DUF6286 domain-containing Asp23/Gls24 family envelope stress response protein [Streptomyces tropicalis]|uniref:DUF6286 domain-containing protein n=1 Tax=Streptomyces tropicalis TaxID=3034234 RepID=A0ABT6A5Y7_9ACTN|nr:DUF6286 domain-containing Asp23/Gls24 family envelope stress response protein [Streptomyces tropicalis]MDF3299240.1 DUF6286 domain-containing protein [Streptomyces tropicalis]
MTGPAQRGRTTVSDRAVRRIAEQAAGEVLPASVPHTAGGAATVRGRRAAVALRVALPYPVPLSELVQRVQRHVAERTRDLTGLTVGTPRLTVTRLSAPPAGSGLPGPAPRPAGPAAAIPAGRSAGDAHDARDARDARGVRDARSVRDTHPDPAARATDSAASTSAASEPGTGPATDAASGTSTDPAADARPATGAVSVTGPDPVCFRPVPGAASAADLATDPAPGAAPVASGRGADAKAQSGGSVPGAPSADGTRRRSAARAPRRRWSARRVPTALLTLLAGGACAAVTADVVRVHATHHPAAGWRMRAVEWLSGHGPGDTPAAVAAGVIAVIGLWLLVLACTPGRRGLLTLDVAGPGWTAAVDRPAVAALVRDDVGDVPGVAEVRVRAGRRRVSVRAGLAFGDLGPAREQATEAARRALEGCRLRRAPRLAVTVVPDAVWQPPEPPQPPPAHDGLRPSAAGSAAVRPQDGSGPGDTATDPAHTPAAPSAAPSGALPGTRPKGQV